MPWGSVSSIGNEPVSTVQRRAATPPASWRDELRWREMSWPSPSPAQCTSAKVKYSEWKGVNGRRSGRKSDKKANG